MCKKHLMLMGIQGSGKGTQAALITKHFGYISLETGALLRAVLEDPEHKHYQAVADTVPHGKLTPDSVIFDLIQEFFDAHPNDHILVDGAVRRIAQREFFDAITKDYIVIHITLTEEEALRRLQGRKMDPVTKEIFGADFEGMVNPTTGNELVIRVDDQDVEKIQKRFAWYRSDIVPLLDSWKADGVEFHTINGEQSREAVWSEIEKILKPAPIESTAEILALKALNRDVDDRWVEWAIEMLMAGFTTKHLVILAGERSPYNQFELRELIEKVLKELQLDYSNKDMIINNYVTFLIQQVFKNKIDQLEALKTMSDLCIELNYPKHLNDFYLLYFAKDDLLGGGDQFYYKDATKDNIDQIIHDKFTLWLT